MATWEFWSSRPENLDRMIFCRRFIKLRSNIKQMPPKTKRPPKKSLLAREDTATQPKLNFELPIRDPEAQRKRLVERIAVARLGMARLELEEAKYMRQLLRIQIKQNNQSHKSQCNTLLEDQQITYTLSCPPEADLMQVILGQYAVCPYQKQSEQTAPQKVLPDESKQKTDDEQELSSCVMKREYLQQFEPCFVRVLEALEGKSETQDR